MPSNRNLILAGAVLLTGTGAFFAGRMTAPETSGPIPSPGMSVTW